MRWAPAATAPPAASTGRVRSNAQAGDLIFTARSTAAGAGQASLNLTIESVSLYSGPMPAPGLAVRLDNGLILPVSVSAVPEPACLACAGGARAE